MIELVVSSLFIGLIVGILGQKSKFCTLSGIRNLIVFKSKGAFMGILGLLAGAAIGFMILSFIVPQSFDTYPAFLKTGPPLLSISILTIIGGIGLGLFSTYADGCPLRMHVRSGEGDYKAIAYLIGFYLGIVFYLVFLEEVINLLIMS